MESTITAEHSRWLGNELKQWQGAGLIDASTAQAIADRYHVVPGRRISLARLLLAVGASFVGIGVIWLVAANLDALSPSARFGCVVALWLLALIGAEWLSTRPGHLAGPAGRLPGRRAGSPVVAAVRLVAALLLGGVIFQAAQSLQVPAFEPRLLGLWAAGCLLHAYLVRSAMPLIVAVATGTGWLLGATLTTHASGLGAVLALAGAAVLATCLSQVHTRERFAVIWREVGAAYALVVLFVAAVPPVTAEGFGWTSSLVLVLLAAAAALVLALVRRREHLLETAGVLAIGVVSVLLVWWQAGQDAQHIGLAEWAQAGLAVAAYVAAALWVAWLGIVYDSPRLTWIATGALVVFTTFQSFGVFAQIIQGAWLFVVLGLVLAGSGYLFDKAQRQLRRELRATATTGSEEGQS